MKTFQSRLVKLSFARFISRWMKKAWYFLARDSSRIDKALIFATNLEISIKIVNVCA